MTRETDPSLWTIATDRSVVLRASRIAAIVGLILGALNYGDLIMLGEMTPMSWLKCALTFLVPYVVSTISSVMAVRDHHQRLDDAP